MTLWATGARLRQASYWLDKAKEGHPAAQYGLSVCLQKGWGTSRDLVAAARWVRVGGLEAIVDVACRRRVGRSFQV